MNSASALSKYIRTLTIGQGRHSGEAFKLLEWQRRFIRGAFSPDVQTAALSIARANGKSVLVAAIGAGAIDVDGPLVEPMAETCIVAASFQQGQVIFRHLKHFLNPTLAAHKGRFRVSDSPNVASISDRETGAQVRVMGNNSKTLHGLQPKLLLLDELAQWEAGALDASLAALSTSLGKIPESRLIALGTRASSELHPFEKMLTGGADYSQVHAALDSDKPFAVRTWKRANPSLNYMPDLRRVIEKEAARARRDASLLPAFEALRLNKGVSGRIASRAYRSVHLAKRAESPEPHGIRGGYVLGVDLGQNAAMSAASAYSPVSGALDAFAVFPQLPSLAERGLRDGVGAAYQTMHERGELIISGERVSSIAGLLAECLKRWGKPSAIVCDRWREAELRQELTKNRFPSGAAIVIRGQGYKDGGEDVRDFRKAILDGFVRAPVSLLLRSALNEARVITDAAGNSKLAKSGEGGRRKVARDDAAAASILAIAEGQRRRVAGNVGKRRRMRVGIAG